MRIPSRFLLHASIAVALAGPPAALAAPVINEFLASNQAGALRDEDNATADWIEFYNPDLANAENLAGWTLTDNAAVRAKWTFPAGVSIPPGGYLVVFASGKDRRVAGANLHTNFSLDAGGEFLGLFPPGSGPAADSLAPFPAQTDDVSYGWLGGGSGPQRVFFSPPSPGAVNVAANAPALPVVFSLSSRAFASGSSLSVTLSNPSPTAVIRYTLDRSVPTAASTLFNAATPIPITASARVRARAFETGRPNGPVTSEIYLALDAAALSFTSALPIMLQHSWNSGHPNATAPAAGTPEDTKKSAWFIFMPQGPGNVASMANLPDIATPGYFERRGSSTFGSPKYSMTMGALDELEQGKQVSALGFPSNDDWVLHAPYQFDRSLIHNDLSYRLSNDSGRYAVRTKHVELFQSVADAVVNGAVTAGTAANTATIDYFGIYSFMEKISRGQQRVDVENITPADNTAPNVQGGYIFKIDRLDAGDAGVAAAGRTWPLVDPKEFTAYPARLPVAATDQKTDLAGRPNDMKAALQATNFMDPAAGYAAHIDVHASIDHHLFNVVAKNADGMRLSGYWHKTRFGKLVMGPIWDFDRAQGSSDGRDLNPNTWRGDNGDFGTDWFHHSGVMNPNYFHFLFQDPNYWTRWLDRWATLRQTTFTTPRVHSLIDAYQEELDPADGANTPAKRNNTRWSGVGGFGYRAAAGATPGTNGTFRGEIAWLKSWWQSRMAFMDGQFVRPVTASAPPGPLASGATVALTAPGQTLPDVKIYYTTNGADPRAASTAKEPFIQDATLATLVGDQNTVRAIVPTSALNTTYGTNWRGTDLNNDNDNWNDFNDSGWYSATPVAPAFAGVGYDDNLAVNFLPFISVRFFSPSQTTAVNPTPVAGSGVPQAVMRNANASCYIRYPFTVSAADLAVANSGGKRIKLRVRYDDGYVCWLNGFDIGRSPTVPAATVPVWNTGIANTHEDNASLLDEELDVTVAALSRLHAGNNVLCFQLMNGGATPNASSDAILQAKMLVVGRSSLPYAANFAPGAAEYTAPLNLTVPTVIRSRALTGFQPSDPPTTGPGGVGDVPNGTSWSAISTYYYFPGAALAGSGNVTLTELNYHPTPPTASEVSAGYADANDFEFIRITNTSASPVDLTSIYFTRGVEFTAGPGLQNWLPAGESVVIVENLAAYQSRHGSYYRVLGEFRGELDDGGERITLLAANAGMIADFTYGDGDDDDWPADADGETSLIYVGGSQSAPGAWRAAVPIGVRVNSGYAGFKAYYFAATATPPAEQDPENDPDKDGLSNLVEYALGTAPGAHTPDPFLLEEGSAGFFLMRRRAGLADATGVLETAPTLAGPWTALPHGAPQAYPDGSEVAGFTLPDAVDRKFIRYRVTRNP